MYGDGMRVDIVSLNKCKPIAKQKKICPEKFVAS